jgi:hypothetical protein
LRSCTLILFFFDCAVYRTPILESSDLVADNT